MNVLFVCTGNTCRSPMAEAIARDMDMERHSFRSAGIYAMEGHCASTYAMQVLADNNIKHNHASSRTTEEAVEWADLILTMTRAHKQMLKDLYGFAGHKIFTLKEYAGGEGDIHDPYGGTKADYEETFAELRRLLHELSVKLS